MTGQVPLNFVTHPGASLEETCFAHGIYEDDAAAKCISNLLAVGYRRLFIDLYWGPERQQWGFCPVAIPLNVPGASSAPVLPSSAPSANLTSAAFNTKVGKSTISSPSGTSLPSSPVKIRRQERSSSSLSSTFSRNASSTISQPLTPTRISSSGELVYNIGPYSCTQTMDLRLLISLISDYFRQTQDTIQANIIYLNFNLHAAASANAPESPAPAPSASNLPSSSNLVGSLFDASVSTYVYTPTQLYDERRNLNDSWYFTSSSRQPLAEYYTTNILPGNVHSTPDGWPCEAYVVVSHAKRLLLGWGSIDPQMQGYNFSGDAGTIFPPNYLASNVQPVASGDGMISSGCFFDPNITELTTVNSSWALSSQVDGFVFPTTADSPTDPLSYLASNLTSCGISPAINQTLLNATADTDFRPYQNASYSASWLWAPNEPRNTTRPGNLFRCALLDLTLTGQWRVEHCSYNFRAACRLNNDPYTWRITPYNVQFSAAPGACPINSTFDVPRTGLENTYLYAHLLSLDNSVIDPHSTDETKTSIWLNFNSLDEQACWVTGGPSATCPYSAADRQKRTVLVPTIAAIIVLIITALTLFVKCTANRRSSKSRRKRGTGGWDYEGVPS